MAIVTSHTLNGLDGTHASGISVKLIKLNGKVVNFKIHKKSHLDPEWAKKNVPWHYDHHMGPDQNKNFGVRTDFFDRLFGTRREYYGTRSERIDYARRLCKYAQHVARKNRRSDIGMHHDA